jgi:hypothetical protein
LADEGEVDLKDEEWEFLGLFLVEDDDDDDDDDDKNVAKSLIKVATIKAQPAEGSNKVLSASKNPTDKIR